MSGPCAGTGLTIGPKPEPELAAEAVRQALAAAGATHAESVLLFLSADFARHGQTHPALLAASRTARCLHVSGATTAGLLTEREWVLDGCAAAALVLARGIGFGGFDEGAPAIALITPDTLTNNWLESSAARIGMVSTDGAGQNPGRVFAHGKLADAGMALFGLRNLRLAIGVSRGVRALTEALPITACEGYDLQRIDQQPALTALLRELPLDLRENPQLPLHLLCACLVVGEPEGAAEQGRYLQIPLIAANGDDRTVTLAARLQTGRHMFWGMRQALAAEHDTEAALDAARAQMAVDPLFAIMFSCMGRGPYFFGAEDRDLSLLHARWPDLPIIGAYGAGEIAPTCEGNRILHNSAVIALFAPAP